MTIVRSWRRRRVCGALALAILQSAASVNAQPGPRSGSVPFVVAGGRIYAEVTLVTADGGARESYAFVDLGGAAVELSPVLFKALGVDRGRSIQMRIGGLNVIAPAQMATAQDYLPFPVNGGAKVDMVLPAAVLRNYQVVIDYRRRRLTLASPGTLRPEGAPTAFEIDEKTGLIAVQAKIDSRPYPMTIDAGSGYTWLSRKAAEGWLDQHPDWRRGQGAVGAANMRMAGDGVEAGGTLMRIARIDIGPVRLQGVGALAIGPNPAGWDIIEWYSKKNAEPVIGWLGANALRPFRLTIDYPNRRLYWLREDASDPDDLDQVGLTLKRRGPTFVVAAVASRRGIPALDGVAPGDRLVEIDGLAVTGATSGSVLAALHGRPGEFKHLVLDRNGQRLALQAKVVAF
jgi:hypothetical protein